MSFDGFAFRVGDRIVSDEVPQRGFVKITAIGEASFLGVLVGCDGHKMEGRELVWNFEPHSINGVTGWWYYVEPEPRVHGRVVDAGGGRIGVVVDRDTPRYITPGTPVTIVPDLPSSPPSNEGRTPS